MSKIYGLFGAMSGKLADVVMSVRAGQQIVRKYQPIVANPATEAQVEARAKLKLLSQMSAVMASAIAIPKDGLRTPRNLFTKLNYDAVSYANETASVNLSAIKLTHSVVTLPEIQVTGSGTYQVQLANIMPDLDRVIYQVFNVMADSTLRLVSTVVSSDGPRFAVNYTPSSDVQKYVVFGYGVRINNESVRSKFAEMEVSNDTLVASLVSSKLVCENDVTLTETKFAEITA